MKMKTIIERVWKGSQSWNYQHVFTVPGTLHKLRVTVKRDSYDEQSWARIELWSGASWTLMQRLSGHEKIMKGLPSSVHDGVSAQSFAKVHDELLRVASELL
jgi:hypothetical protein